MIKKVILLTTLFIIIVSCSQAYSQLDSKINGNDSILICNECDSLYALVCPSESGNSKFTAPETFPHFPGGEKEMLKFIAKNLQWPAECAEMGIQGRVIIRFIISETGEIICPKILRSLYPAMDKEALRVINLMPDFVPASNDGVPIQMCYTLPVLFKLEI